MELSEGVSRMEKVIDSLHEDLGRIRAGRANPEILDTVTVDVYESKMPINHVATISVPDARTFVIQPWDESNVKAIEKAILSSDIGMTPVVDGKIIRLTVPALTAELREEYIRDAKEREEHARNAIRGIRHEILDAVDEEANAGGVSEDDVKRRKDEIENVVKDYLGKIDEMIEKKQEELRKV